jgi:DNA-binding NarL/FixJ family response regulator
MLMARASEPVHPSAAAAAAVLVAHANPLLAAGVGSALAGRMTVANVDGQDLWALLPHARAGVVITDHARAQEVLVRLADHGRPWRLLIIEETLSGSQLRQALDQGVGGCLHPACPLHDLHQAVDSLSAGCTYLCGTMSRRLLQCLNHAVLTPRESAVLGLLCDGLDNKSIAWQLQMALGTVKVHVKSILAKMQVSNRTQAVAAAHSAGLAPRRTVAP